MTATSGGSREGPYECRSVSVAGVPERHSIYLGIDVHKRYARVAVMDEAGAIVEEVRVFDANLDDFAQHFAGAEAALEATSNYYHIHDTLSEQLHTTSNV